MIMIYIVQKKIINLKQIFHHFYQIKIFHQLIVNYLPYNVKNKIKNLLNNHVKAYHQILLIQLKNLVKLKLKHLQIHLKKLILIIHQKLIIIHLMLMEI